MTRWTSISVRASSAVGAQGAGAAPSEVRSSPRTRGLVGEGRPSALGSVKVGHGGASWAMGSPPGTMPVAGHPGGFGVGERSTGVSDAMPIPAGPGGGGTWVRPDS
jgi:hypothetical protein